VFCCGEALAEALWREFSATPDAPLLHEADGDSCFRLEADGLPFHSYTWKEQTFSADMPGLNLTAPKPNAI
jgi:hypothetical protein